MEPVGRIDVLNLFDEERADLLTLLSSLDAPQWALPTVCAPWSVKDLVAHLVADDLGIVSGGRDGYRAGHIEAPSYEDLVAAIDAQNDAWVQAMHRLSPQVLVELLRFGGERAFTDFRARDLDAVGDPVDWAGPDRAPVWLHVAREYTERWAHGQQIRDAVGAPGMFTRRLFAPVLDAYVRALPHTFRGADAAPGTQVALGIAGDAGGDWTLVREHGGWVLYAGTSHKEADASVTIDQDDVWRVFTRGLSPAEARGRAVVTGDDALAMRVFERVSILA